MQFNISNFNPNWIASEIDEHCIQYMDGLGFHLCDKKNKEDRYPGYNAVTTSQMRNIFTEVKRIEVKISSDKDYKKEKANVLLLRPKIAYNTARVTSKNNHSRMKDLRLVLEKGLNEVRNFEQFERFSQFFEGVIAYHKVYGGKD